MSTIFVFKNLLIHTYPNIYILGLINIWNFEVEFLFRQCHRISLIHGWLVSSGLNQLTSILNGLCWWRTTLPMMFPTSFNNCSRKVFPLFLLRRRNSFVTWSVRKLSNLKEIKFWNTKEKYPSHKLYNANEIVTKVWIKYPCLLWLPQLCFHPKDFEALLRYPYSSEKKSLELASLKYPCRTLDLPALL